MGVATLVMSISALVCVVPTLILAIYAFIEIKGMKNSTHQIQYVPVPEKNTDEQGFQVLTEEQKSKIEESYGNDLL